MTGDGFVCGQTRDRLTGDRLTVTCWTVGVDHPSYRQTSHPFRDKGTLVGVWNDPPSFEYWQYGSDRPERFEAFTATDP